MSAGKPADDASARRDMGERLRESRKYLGLRQEEVAQYLDIPRTALTDIENGSRRVEALEQSVGYFTGDEAVSAGLPADVAHLARRVADLSTEDRAELGRFADYLKARAKGEGE